LMSLHGGTFELKSKLREGTEGLACFPAARVMEELPAVTEAVANQKPGLRGRRAA
jgi:two-component system, cell cycle sensor histidine kinase PleC